LAPPTGRAPRQGRKPKFPRRPRGRPSLAFHSEAIRSGVRFPAGKRFRSPRSYVASRPDSPRAIPQARTGGPLIVRSAGEQLTHRLIGICFFTGGPDSSPPRHRNKEGRPPIQCQIGKISDLRRSRRLEIVNGSKLCGHWLRSKTRTSALRGPVGSFPSPQPSPLGRG